MQEPQGARLRVLVIEDEANLRLLLSIVLTEQANAEVMDAADADVGLMLAGEHQPDVVVLDLNLPEGPQGLDVIVPLKDAAPRCRIVVHSAAWPRCEEAMARGADSFVLKDVDYTELVEAVRGG